ncbi:MAG: PAC2 family protein [Candidatus Nitrosopolaris sp.]
MEWKQRMRLDNIKQLKTDGFNVFASLPDMGKVGGLVSAYLAKNSKSECIAEIVSNEKPWVSYFDGIVKSVTDLYQLYYDKEHNLLIFTGNSQPQEPSELYQLCKIFLDHVQTIGRIRRLYSAGGYLRQHLTGAPMVCGVVSNPRLKQVLLDSGIDILSQEIKIITWFNGLILGLAGDRNIEAIGLFGEISETTVPQPLAAKSILKAFAKIESIQLDTKGLDKQYESILEDIQKQKEPPSFRPGIG